MLAPPPWGNPGSATELYSIFKFILTLDMIKIEHQEIIKKINMFCPKMMPFINFFDSFGLHGELSEMSPLVSINVLPSSD